MMKWMAVLAAAMGLMSPPAVAQQLRPESFAAAMERLEQNVAPVVPLTPGAETLVREGRVTDWGYRNSATYREIDTPEEAAERARAIKAAGFNVALIGGAHYRQAHRSPERFEELIRNARLAVEACHREGIRAIDHNDFTIWWSEGYDLLFANPDWLQKDVQYGLPLRYYCLSNPGFVEDTRAYVRRFVAETGLDGFMIDEANYFERACGCEHCREQFKADTGYEMPRYSGSPVWHNREEPLWRLWLRWRAYASARFIDRVAAAARESNPDFVIMGYSTAFQLPEVVTASEDMFVRARVAQWIGFEGTNIVYSGYRSILADLMLRLSVVRSSDKYAWTQVPAASLKELRFGLFLSAMAGHAPWAGSRSGGDTLAPVLNWDRWAALTAPREPIADVGLVLSLSTRDFADELYGHLQNASYMGWAQTLADRGVFYEALLDHGPQVEDLSRFRVVIVPGAEALPASLNRRLVAFAENGGTVIVTGPVGRLDDYGFVRERSELGQAVGLTSLALRDELSLKKVTISGQGRATVKPKGLGLDDALELDEAIVYRANYGAVSNDHVLATFDDGTPAAVEARVGTGRIVHTAFLPSWSTAEPRLRLGAPLEAWDHGQSQDLMMMLVRRAGERVGYSHIEGDGVIGSAYRDQNRVVVHLLNVSGLPIARKGDKITEANSTPIYPELGPIDVYLTIPAVKDARWLAPDMLERTAEVVPSDGGVTIRLPAGTLKDYGAIELTLDGEAVADGSER